MDTISAYENILRASSSPPALDTYSHGSSGTLLSASSSAMTFLTGGKNSNSVLSVRSTQTYQLFLQYSISALAYVPFALAPRNLTGRTSAASGTSLTYRSCVARSAIGIGAGVAGSSGQSPSSAPAAASHTSAQTTFSVLRTAGDDDEP